ncbi:MAG: hypothetical protein H0W81_01950 [Chloroflexi bacterium]|nr:hypothetical protein [Chloroflexota bacterium]
MLQPRFPTFGCYSDGYRYPQPSGAPMTNQSQTPPSLWRGTVAMILSNRIQLADLPVGARWLARVALALAVVMAVLLVATPLNLRLPGGGLVVQRSDNPTINRLVFAIVMIGFAAGLAALGYAVSVGVFRRWRLVVTGMGLAALATIPADALGIGPPWAIPIMLLGLASGFALFAALIFGIPRARWILPVLAGIPPLVGLAMVVTAGMFDLPTGYTPAFFETYELTPVMTRLAATDAMFIVLGLWATVEYGRGLGKGAAQSGQITASLWLLLPVLLGIKAAWLVLTSLGWLPGPLIPARTAGGIVFGDESWLSLVQAIAFGGVIGFWLLRSRTRPDRQGVLPALLLVAVPLVGAFILPQLGLAIDGFISDFGTRLTLIPRDPQPKLDDFVLLLDRSQDVLLAAAPAIAAYFAAAAGLLSLARRGWRGGTIFLLAFAAWTIVPSTTWLIREGFGITTLFEGPMIGDGTEAILGQVHPITLDLVLTAVVLGLSIAWWAGWQKHVRPPELLVVLVLSTLVAYGGSAAGIFGVVLFWVGLGFPILAQFVFDARALNEERPGRDGRVLAALGFALLVSASTILLIALEFVGPDHPGFEAFAKRLLLVPLVVVLAGAAIFRPPPRQAAA